MAIAQIKDNILSLSSAYTYLTTYFPSHITANINNSLQLEK